jgi:thioredoxin reductase
MPVVILGAGPAGMTCANALRSFGLDALVVERDARPGGAQRANFHPNIWLLGAPEESGRDLTERMVRHFESLPLALRLGADTLAVEAGTRGFRVRLSSPSGEETRLADALVLATGMRPRATDALWRLASASARVIIGPLSDTIRDGIRDQTVLILGGGDNALDHALYLAARGNRITARTRAAFSARRHFIEACALQPNIRLVDHAPLEGIVADDRGLTTLDKGEHHAYDWLLVMYGYHPNTEILERFAPEIRPRLTASGHIQADAWQRTSVPGLYAAGDITDPPQPSVLSALAQGLTAAKAIQVDGRAT